MRKINPQNSPLFARGLRKWEAFVASYSGPYDLSPAVYAGMNQKIDFVCPTHGAMQMDAKNMMAGKECKLCSFAARKGRTRTTLKKMLIKFEAAHGDRYDYSDTVFRGSSVPLDIRCREHGVFQQLPWAHAKGSGCPKCAYYKKGSSQRLAHDEFVARIEKLFPGQFDLSGVEYSNNHTPITIRCIEHDQLCTTKPGYLFNSANPCTKCNHMRSVGEEEVAAFLSTFTTVVRRDRTLLAPKEVDIYLPEYGLAVEFCGEYWHSCGSREEERDKRDSHYQKFVRCAEQDIRLITVFAGEWKTRSPQIKRLLRNAVGKGRGRVMARKCDLRRVPHADASKFFERYHIQGGAGAGEHYGLYWKGALVACMRFTNGANDRGRNSKSRMWTLARYATRVSVVGGASRLFRAFLREYQPSEVKSFSDNRYFSGGVYEKLGFARDADLDPDYQVWSPKIGLRPKTHYQRKHLPARLKEHGTATTFDPDTDPRTETEMTYLMGARRLYDCGKVRWVWRSGNAVV